jgi:hypothetical protein
LKLEEFILTDISDCISEGVKNALQEYLEISGAYWLWHAPEYFITTSVARSIAKQKYYVYMDVPLKDIYKREYLDKRGLKSKIAGIRPDISVWNKEENSIRACIEIKKEYSISELKEDIERLNKIMKLKTFDCHESYLVVYSDDAKSESTYLNRYENWAQHFKWVVEDKFVCRESDEDGYFWSFCVLKHPEAN